MVEILYNDDALEEREKLEEAIENRRSKLVEQFVDPEYILPHVHPQELACLAKTRKHYGKYGYYPIPFYDLMSVMADCKCINSIKKMSKFNIVHTLRHLWRGGYIRRYVRGKSRRGNGYGKNQGRGDWWGVHYSLYTKEEEDEHFNKK